MFSSLKNKLYFPLASYFRFFAAIRLKRWKPRVIVVTGSNGKTTLLHLLESQLQEKARFSHHANSSYGIPFDILDLHRKTLQRSEWIRLILRAPLQVFAKLPKESIYVVEADTDRAGEGKFLAEFLRPEVVLWVSVGVTHAANFNKDKTFASVEEAIAYDFGYFLEFCSQLAVINGDLPLELKQVGRTETKIESVTKSEDLNDYRIEERKTTFIINKEKYSFDALLPEEIFYALKMCKTTVKYLGLSFDASFAKFEIPPGRGSIFQGIKYTTIIDSSYNANLSSLKATLLMFDKLPSRKKWVVLGDMLELGEKEQEEHEKLAEVLNAMDLEKIILIGKRVSHFTYPKLKSKKVEKFEKQKDALDYLEKNIVGGEAILFKGSQSLFLEGIIEKLLRDKKDVVSLPRRGEFWDMKRRGVGL